MRIKLIRLLGILIIIFPCNDVCAQDQPQQQYELLKKTLEEEVAAYNCSSENGERTKAVQDSVLDRNLYQVFQAIILNGSDVAANASAFSYTQDEDNNKISLSTIFTVKTSHFIKVGITATGKDSPFDLYSKDSWSNNAGATIGYNKAWRRNSQFFKSGECDELIEKRTPYVDSLLLSYKKILQYDIPVLEEQKRAWLQALEAQKQFSNTDPASYLDSLKKVNKKLDDYKSLMKLEATDAEDKIKNDLSVFDSKYDILYGYHVWWLESNIGVSNTTLNLNDSLLPESIHKVKNVSQLSFSLAGMFNHNAKRTIQYVRVETMFSCGSFLNNPTIGKDVPAVVSPIGNQNEYALFYDDRRNLGNYKDIEKMVGQFNFSVYYANFFILKKSVGLSGQFQVNTPMGNVYSSDYKTNFSINGGLIFRSAKEADWSKATFGIVAGVQNLPVKTIVKDYFTAKVFIGVPFNVFMKK